MPCSALSRRLALWLAVCALMLKAAVPLLATTAAHAQGKALVEVCTVYGVATVMLDGQPEAPEHVLPHAGDACVLSALLAFGHDGPSLHAGDMRVACAAPPLAAATTAHRHDATAAWAARLKHGPPHLA